MAPITAPSVHQRSLSFCSPLYPLRPTPRVFIRLIEALCTVTLLLILMVMTAESTPHLTTTTTIPQCCLTPGSDLESPTPGFSCYRTHYYRAMMSAFCQRTWSTDLDYGFRLFLSKHYPSSSHSATPTLSPFLLLAWLTACLGFTGVGLLLIWGSVCF